MDFFQTFFPKDITIKERKSLRKQLTISIGKSKNVIGWADSWYATILQAELAVAWQM